MGRFRTTLLHKNAVTRERISSVTADVNNHLHPASGGRTYDAAGTRLGDSFNTLNVYAESRVNPIAGPCQLGICCKPAAREYFPLLGYTTDVIDPLSCYVCVTRESIAALLAKCD